MLVVLPALCCCHIILDRSQQHRSHLSSRYRTVPAPPPPSPAAAVAPIMPARPMQQQQVQPVPAAAPALPVFTRAAAPITRSESKPAAKDKAKRRMEEEEAEVLPSAGEAIPVRVTLLHSRVQVLHAGVVMLMLWAWHVPSVINTLHFSFVAVSRSCSLCGLHESELKSPLSRSTDRGSRSEGKRSRSPSNDFAPR